MKISKFLMALVLLVPFFQSCQDDITDLDDPRDAVAKLWRVTDNTPTGSLGYDVTISKDAVETTRVLFTNFHNLGTTDKLYATLAGSILTIPSQQLDDMYTIEGSGTVSTDLKNINFSYSVQEGADPANDYTAVFGVPITSKKKSSKPAL